MSAHTRYQVHYISYIQLRRFLKMLKVHIIIILLTVIEFCLSTNLIYSSFYAPLYDPRILNYRVDVNFDPDGGQRVKDEYRKVYGYRGEKLISDLGNGKGLAEREYNKEYGDVKVYYTYPDANNS